MSFHLSESTRCTCQSLSSFAPASAGTLCWRSRGDCIYATSPFRCLFQTIYLLPWPVCTKHLRTCIICSSISPTFFHHNCTSPRHSRVDICVSFNNSTHHHALDPVKFHWSARDTSCLSNRRGCACLSYSPLAFSICSFHLPFPFLVTHLLLSFLYFLFSAWTQHSHKYPLLHLLT